MKNCSSQRWNRFRYSYRFSSILAVAVTVIVAM